MTAPTYGLTRSQADCARVIAALTDFLGNSPTYAEIADELCLANKGRAHRLVQALKERGWIKPWCGSRGLKLTRSPPPFDYSAIGVTEAGRGYLERAA